MTHFGAVAPQGGFSRTSGVTSRKATSATWLVPRRATVCSSMPRFSFPPIEEATLMPPNASLFYFLPCHSKEPFCASNHLASIAADGSDLQTVSGLGTVSVRPRQITTRRDGGTKTVCSLFQALGVRKQHKACVSGSIRTQAHRSRLSGMKVAFRLFESDGGKRRQLKLSTIL